MEGRIKRRRRRVSEKYKFLVPVGMSLFICLTNLSSAPLAWIYVAFCLLYSILMPLHYSVAVVLVNIVYLGYSKIALEQVIGIYNNSVMHFCYIAIVARAVYMHLQGKAKLAFDWKLLPIAVLMAYMTISQFTVGKLYGFFFLFMALCLWLILLSCKSYEGKRNLIIQFALILSTVFLYHALHKDLFGDRYGRFYGSGDPNDFSLWCNVCLVLLIWCSKRIPQRIKLLFGIVLTVGVLITISISGIATLLMIVAAVLLERYYKNRKFWIIVGCLATAGVLVLCFVPVEGFLGMGGIFGRMAKIILALRSGDLSSVTTGRTDLWEMYLNAYKEAPFISKVFGDQKIINAMLAGGAKSSHNFYIDFLLDYGAVGLVMLLGNIANQITGHIKRRETGLLMLNLVIIINAFFRTLSNIFVWIPLLMM